jgi:hypothetical protein
MSPFAPCPEDFCPNRPKWTARSSRDRLKAAFDPNRTMADYVCHRVDDLRGDADFGAPLGAMQACLKYVPQVQVSRLGTHGRGVAPNSLDHGPEAIGALAR